MKTVKYRNGWFYYAGTGSTYHMVDGTCLAVYRGYYAPWFTDANGRKWQSYPIQVNECPV